MTGSTPNNAGEAGKSTYANKGGAESPHVETALSGTQSVEQSPCMKAQHVEVLV